jgi:hypothetical protein
MGVFDSIPIRNNADTILVDASWWNIIRTALVNYFGSGSTGAAQFTIVDNQATPANITNMVIDHTVYQYASVEYSIIRSDGTHKRRERGMLYLSYDTVNGWVLERDSGNTDALNLASSLSITSAGQVQYISDSMGGSYAGMMTWKFNSTFVQEGI